MLAATCGICARMERARAAASLSRFRAVAYRKNWRPRVPKAANGKPVAVENMSAPATLRPMNGPGERPGATTNKETNAN